MTESFLIKSVRPKLLQLVLSAFLIISFNTFYAADYFWVGNSGNWNEASHWSLSNGGQGGAGVPSASDNAIFNKYSFTEDATISIQQDANCKNLVWSDSPFNHHLVGSGDLNVNGSITIQDNINATYNGTIHLLGNEEDNHINTVAVLWNADFIIKTDSDYTLLTNFAVSENNHIYLEKGTFNTGGNLLYAGEFETRTAAPKELNLGTSNVTILKGWDVESGDNFILNTDQSEITFLESITPEKISKGDYDYNQLSTKATCTAAPIDIIFTVAVTSDYNGEDITCAGACNGELTVTITSGGGGPYGYKLNDGINPDQFFNASPVSGLCEGNWTVTVIDSSQLIAGTTYWQCSEAGNVIAPPDNIFINVLVPISPTCPGLCDGSIVTDIGGGTGGLTVTWPSIPFVGTSPAGIVCAGNHDVEVEDANGCILNSTVTLDPPDPIIPNLTITPVSCNSVCDGEIIAAPSGGDGGPYIVSWAGVPIDDPNANPATGLCELVTYTVTVEDGLGCTVTEDATVPDKDSITIDFINPVAPQCFNSCDGQIGLVITGGSGVYNDPEWYEGVLGAGVLFAHAGPAINPTNLCGSTDYYVIVTDNTGCQDSIQMPQLTPPTEIMLDTTVTDLTCFGDGTGAIDLIPTGGTVGVGGYTFAWTTLDGSGLVPGDEDQTGLSGGDYDVTVTDDNGCFKSLVDITVESPDEIFANGTPTDISCFNLTDGEIDINTTGGTGPYTWAWTSTVGAFVDPGTEDLMALDSGCYTLTISDLNGCGLTGNDTTICIIKPGEIFANATITNVDCSGNGTGLITLAASNGTDPYQYDMNFDLLYGDIPILPGLVPGAYTVSVRDDNLCIKDTTINITEPNPLVVSEDVPHTDITCFGDDDGALSISITGGSGPYETQWTTPAGFPIADDVLSATGLGPGTYTANVEDDNSCITSISIVIDEPTEVVLDIAITDITCFGDGDGIIDLTPTGGSGVYTIDWDNDGTGDFDDTEDLNPIAAGMYCVSVNDGNCQTDSCLIEVVEPDPIYFNATVVQMDCFGDDDATINLAVTGGTVAVDYVYTWSPLVSVSSNAIGLTDQTYNIDVEDDNGCDNDTSIVINAIPELTVTTSSVQSTCGNSNGSVTADVFGGTFPYTITWQPANVTDVSNTLTAPNLPAGCQDVTVTDDNGCVVTAQECVTDESAPTATLTPMDPTCSDNCNGFITTSITGGVLPYTTTWTSTDPTFTDPGTDDIFNLCGEDYTFTVEDANNCIFTQTESLTAPDAITATATLTQVDCFADSTGAIDVTITGGTVAGLYSYTWLGPGLSETTEDLANLPEGTFCLRVTDDNNCFLDSCFDITQNNELLLTTSSVTAQCSSDDGSATVTHTGGVPVYLYQWMDAAFTDLGTNATQPGLGLGTYHVEVTDGNGCIDTATVAVSETTGPTIEIDTIINVACNGGNDGQIQTTVVSANAFTISWSHSASTLDDVATLTAGSYTITVQDDVTLCTSVETMVVTEPDPLTVPGLSYDAACFGEATGSINLTPAGGTTPYDYDWDDDGAGEFGDTEDLVGIVAGTYNVQVRDDNSCISTNTFVIGEPTEITTTTGSLDASVCGLADGTAFVEATDGTPGYSYEWFVAGDNTTPLGVNDTLYNSLGGCYDVYVTDASIPAPPVAAVGCTVMNSVCIVEGPATGVSSTTTDVSCFGADDGTMTIVTTATDLVWTGPTLVADDETNATGLSAGIYTVTVTDASGCVTGIVDTVAEPDEIVIVETLTNPLCAGAFTGAIDLDITGGVGGLNYSWTGPVPFPDPGIEDIAGLEQGQYCVTVTDGTGCVADDCYDLNDPISVIISVAASPTQCDNNTGIVTATVSGTSGPYTYSWTGPNAPHPGDPTLINLAQGTYEVTVTDNNGCTAVDQDDVELNNAPVVTLVSVADVSCFGLSDGNILIDVTGGTMPYTFAWSDDIGPIAPPAGTSEDLTFSPAGNYVLDITDDAGCTTTYLDTILQPDALTLTDATTHLICNGVNIGAVDITVGGGTIPYIFDWTEAAVSFSASEDVSGLSAGTYDVLVTDDNGCTINDSYTITTPTAISLVGASVNSSCLTADGEASVTATDGAGGYSYVWTDVTLGQPGTAIGGNSDVLPLVPAGSYQVVVTDASGCADSVIVAVVDNNAATITTDVTNVLCFGNANGAIDVTPSEPLNPITWSGPVPFVDPGTEDLTLLEAGDYTFSGTNAGGCITTEIITVGGPTAPLDVAEVLTNLTCYNDGSGEIDLTISGGTPSVVTGYDVSWNGPNGFTSTFEDLVALDSGTYDLVVTDSNLCNYTNSYVITQPDSLEIVATSNTPTCGLADGDISVVVSGGTLNYNYQWTNVTTATLLGTTDSEINLAAGIYQVDVVDGALCANSITVTLPDDNGPQLTTVITDILCNGDANGEIELTITGGGPFTIDWTTADGSGLVPNDEDQTGLTAGTYDLVVEDQSIGCISTASIVLTEPDVLDLTETASNLTCNGDGSGAIDITVTGGTIPYDFVWTESLGGSGSVPGDEDQTGLSEGTYEVLITDDNDCVIGNVYVLTEPDVLAITAVVVDDSCNQAMTGDIDVTVTGGTVAGAYQYDWATTTDPNFSTNEDLNFIGAETYTLIVEDDNGCAETYTTPITEPTALIADVTVTSSNCTLSDGEAVSNPSGGTIAVDYTYSWVDVTDPLNPLSATNTLSLAPSGTYVYSIIDDMGCQLDTNITISDIGAPVITVDSVTNVSCFGGDDGAVYISATSINTPLTYLWNPNGIGQAEDLTDVPADDYTVAVSDILGCTSFETVSVTEPTVIEATYTTVDATCGFCNGEATVVVTGGTAGYAHLWSDGQSTDVVTGLCAGVYTDQITDANGCVQNVDIAVSNIGGPTDATITTTNVICSGDDDGTADVLAIGGVAPITYYWPDIPATGGSQTNLAAGTYSVEMTDDNGCTLVEQLEILDGTLIEATSIIDPATCGNSDGNITVSVTGGVGSLDYLWSTGATTLPLNNQPEGIYILNITDDTPCTISETFTIPGIGAPTLSLADTAALCFGDSTGSITSTVVDVVGTMSYQWYDEVGDEIDDSTNSSIIGIPAGEYTLEGEDDGTGCLTYATITVTQPDTISLSNPAITNATCAGLCDGEVSIVASGGTLGYTYSWFSGLSTTNSATGMCAGSDTVTITDANGCNVMVEVIVTEPTPISIITDSVTDAYCVNSTDGAIYITANGGSGSYNYSWTSDPAGFVDAGEDISGLLPMNYIVDVSNTDGSCTVTDTIPVDTTIVVFAVAGVDTSFCAGECVTLIGSATGTLTYTTEWFDDLGASISTNDSLEVCSSTAGTQTYILEVDDAGCTHTDTVDVVVNPLPVADAGEDYLEIYGSDVELGGSPTGPDNATFSWVPTTNFVDLLDSTDSNPTINMILDEDYIVFVTDTNGCVNSDTVNVEVVPEIIFPNGFTPNGDGVNDTWQIDNMTEFPESVVEVYNRWGQQLFISVGYVQQFDGTYEGRELPVGTYYYIITLNHPNYPDAYTGPITIMR